MFIILLVDSLFFYINQELTQSYPASASKLALVNMGEWGDTYPRQNTEKCKP